MLVQKLLAVALAAALLRPAAIYGQAPPTASPGGLKLIVVRGQNEKNNIKLKLAVVPVVEVRDERDRVVPGVRLAFVLPNFGASGTFSDGTASMLVWTDSDGRATASGLVPNNTEGKFNIRVTATYSGKEGSTTILMENTATEGPRLETKKKSNKLVYIIAGAGGAAAAAIFAANSSSNKSSAPAPVPPAPTSVTLGAVTVGGPR